MINIRDRHFGYNVLQAEQLFVDNLTIELTNRNMPRNFIQEKITEYVKFPLFPGRKTCRSGILTAHSAQQETRLTAVCTARDISPTEAHS